MKKTPPPLTAAQREIMEIVGERGEVIVREVRESLCRRFR
jgi:predicted transcriptional regulator